VRSQNFRTSAKLSSPAKEVFDWHLKSGAVERMLSSIKELRLLSQEGSRLILEIRIGFSWEKWVLEFKISPDTLSGKFVQIHGPFRNWSYTFKIHASGEQTSTLEEEVEYALPFPLSASRFYKKVERYFRWRQKTLEDDLKVYARASLPPLKILISGSTGLVGAALVPFLKVAGHEVVRLVRSKKKADPSAIFWNPQSGDRC
jgi:ligand-binding SRPBCC domain-containing protein